MLKNYLKTALRNLLRQKTSTFLNLAGLTLAITCSIILTLIIIHHLGYDSFHSKKDRIYRVVHRAIGNNQDEFQSGIPKPLPEAFALEFPEAEAVVFTSYRSNALIQIPSAKEENRKFLEERGVVFTEPSYFEIFDRTVIAGDGPKSLDEPNEAVISERFAARYFGKTDVIGETVIFDGNEFRIGAVMGNVPGKTDLPFELMLSYATLRDPNAQQNWYSIWSDEHCYFLLREGNSLAQIESRLPAFTRKYRNNEQDKGQFMVIPLSGMHFDNRFETYSYESMPRAVLITLGVIALILILTGCINFINLSTADAIKRSREVGVRKTLGGSRRQLMLQFLGETFLITVIAVVLSLALSQVAIGLVNPFMGLDLSLQLTSGPLTPMLLVVTIFVSLFSGLYPSMVVSSYNPALALKNRVTNRSSSAYLMRSGLVVFQFFISQVFIIGAIVMIKQTDLMVNADMGFKKDAVIVVPLPDKTDGDREQLAIRKRTIRNEMEKIPHVKDLTLSASPPFSGDVNKTMFRIEGDDKEYLTQYKEVDGEYLSFYEIRVLEGTPLGNYDTLSGFVVNETFAHGCGYSPDQIIGKMIRMYGREYPVKGVVADFNTSPLRNKIEPIVLYNQVKRYRTMSLKVNMAHAGAVIDEVKARWTQFYPDHIFEYEFLDENIRTFYESQTKMTTLLTAFAGIAIFIGCLGLFGLVTYMTNQKTKEIGVRKVLGATVENILINFSWSYVKLIAVGFVAALPIGWFAMTQFLEQFAYKIELNPWIFMSSFLVTLLIALLTVGYKSLRTAIANPIESLRYE